MLHWFYIIAAGQGVFLASILIFSRRNNSANRMLAVFILLISFVLMSRFLSYNSGIAVAFPFYVISDTFGFLYGPLIYWYISLLTSKRSVKFRVTDPVHLLPFAVSFILSLSYFSMPESLQLHYIQHFEIGIVDTKWVIKLACESIMIIVYLSLSVRILIKHSRGLEEFCSEVLRNSLSWLKTLAILTILLLFSYLALEFEYYYESMQLSILHHLTLLCMSLLVYVSGYFALTQPEVLSLPEYIPLMPGIDESDGIRKEQPGGEDGGMQKYARTKIPDELSDQIAARINEAVVADRLYLEPEINLDQFAASINFPPYQVSQVINSRFGENFFVFINRHRIAEAARLLSDPGSNDRTILEIAFSAGFNSKASFNMVFKKINGMTPTEYRKRPDVLRENHST